MNTQKTFVHIVFLVILTFNLPASGSTSQDSQKGTASDFTSGLVGAIVGALTGALTGGLTAWLNYRGKIGELERSSELQKKEEKREEIAKLRRDYLNPLKFAAKELNERLEIIITRKLHLTLEENETQNQEKLRTIKEFSNLIDSTIHTQDDWNQFSLPLELVDFKGLALFIKEAKYIKDYVTSNYRPGGKHDFIARCNGGETYFTASTLYLTVAYIAYATRVREKLPFSTLVPKYNQLIDDLVNHIEEFRRSFEGEYGVWSEVQDSMGEVAIKPDGTVINYYEFCDALSNDETCLYFLRLSDFYRDLAIKLPDIIEACKSLRNLIRLADKEVSLYEQLLEA